MTLFSSLFPDNWWCPCPVKKTSKRKEYELLGSITKPEEKRKTYICTSSSSNLCQLLYFYVKRPTHDFKVTWRSIWPGVSSCYNICHSWFSVHSCHWNKIYSLYYVWDINTSHLENIKKLSWLVKGVREGQNPPQKWPKFGFGARLPGCHNLCYPGLPISDCNNTCNHPDSRQCIAILFSRAGVYWKLPCRQLGCIDSI